MLLAAPEAAVQDSGNYCNPRKSKTSGRRVTKVLEVTARDLFVQHDCSDINTKNQKTAHEIIKYGIVQGLIFGDDLGILTGAIMYSVVKRYHGSLQPLQCNRTRLSLGLYTQIIRE